MITIATSVKRTLTLLCAASLVSSYQMWTTSKSPNVQLQSLSSASKASHVLHIRQFGVKYADDSPDSPRDLTAHDRKIDESRIKAENLCKGGHYRQAIALLKKIWGRETFNAQVAFVLGRAYALNGDYEEALGVLGNIRAGYCFFYGKLGERSGLYLGPSSCSNCDFRNLSPQVAASIDTSARMIIEKAVLAEWRRGKVQRLQPLNARFRSNHEYQLLTAALALGSEYNKRDQYEQSSACYQMANENVASLPPSVVNGLMVTGTISQRWNKLALETLGYSENEKENWDYQCLRNETARLPVTDIRVAATNHMMALTLPSGSARHRMLQDALDSCILARGVSTHETANIMSDLGLSFFRENRFDDAEKLLTQALAEFVKEKASGDEGDTRYNLAFVLYAKGDTIGAKRQFQAASQCWSAAKQNDVDLRENDGSLFDSASENAALLAVENDIDPADEQFLLKRDQYLLGSNAEASAQLGLFYFKQGNFEKARAPLQNAASFYFPLPEAPPPPEDQGWTGPAIAVKLLDESDILPRFFQRGPVLSESIASRYCEADLTFDQQIEEGRVLCSYHPHADYRYLVKQLYCQLLLKQGNLAELSRFERRCQLSGLPLPCAIKTTSTYLQAVAQIIGDGWFCPLHTRCEQAIYRVLIDKNGHTTWARLQEPGSTNEFNRSIKDAMDFSTYLPAPPSDWQGGEITVVLDGNQVTPLTCVFDDMMRMGWREDLPIPAGKYY